MNARNVPLCLWDFCSKWACVIKACTASNLYAHEARAPWEVVIGLVEFDLYEPIWYYDSGDFPEPKRFIGHWLGEATHIGQAMCCYGLPLSGIPIIRSLVQPVLGADKVTDKVKQKLQQFDVDISEKLGIGKT